MKVELAEKEVLEILENQDFGPVPLHLVWVAREMVKKGWLIDYTTMDNGVQFKIATNGRSILAWHRMQPATEEKPVTGNEDCDWDEYRNLAEPGKPLLTAAYIKERFGIPKNFWSKKNDKLAEIARKHRKRHPDVRGFVFRECDVNRVSDRRSGE